MTAAAVAPSRSTAQPTPRHAVQRRRRRYGRAIVPILLILAGIFVLLYPVVATQYNNVKQREFADKYQTQIGQTDHNVLKEGFAKAVEYNKTLSGVPILDPYLLQVSSDPTSAPYKAYLKILGDFDAMARVRVPTASIDLPVRHGTSDKVIGEGAGHLYGTSLPVGGVGTHSVLTSHTGMADATLFDHLTSVQKGDKMYIDVYGETLAYEVDNIKIVLPNQIDDLKPVAGQDLLTLFTCTPYAVNTHRLLVTGHRIPFTPEAAPQTSSVIHEVFKMEPWMYGLVAVAATALALLIYIVVRERRRARHYEAQHAGEPDVTASTPPVATDAQRAAAAEEFGLTLRDQFGPPAGPLETPDQAGLTPRQEG